MDRIAHHALSSHMRTHVLICIPVPENLAPELDRAKAFPSVSTIENGAPLHLTLAVGVSENMTEAALRDLESRLRKIRFPEFPIAFTGTEGFWSTALVLTTELPQELEKLRADAISALFSALWDEFELFDARHFRPHVTIGRIWWLETSNDLPVIMEEIPESVWKIGSFALWTKAEGEEYAPVSTFQHSNSKGKKRDSALSFARLVARTVAQISLFFTCFLPLWAFMNDGWDSLVKWTAHFPELLYAAAFLSTLSATAAVGSTLKRPMNRKFAHAVTAFALACSVALFAAEIRELSVCYATESEEFFCQGIYEALIWSSGIMVWLLLLYFGIPTPKKK